MNLTLMKMELEIGDLESDNEDEDGGETIMMTIVEGKERPPR